MSPAERTAQEHVWQMRVAQAQQVAMSAGTLPAAARAVIERLSRGREDWRDILHDWMTREVVVDQTWASPNRKMLGAYDLYLPGSYRENVGKIVIALDTSGSINRACVRRGLEEINVILEDLRPSEVHLIFVNAAVVGKKVFEEGQSIEVDTIPVGGGTRFEPAFEYVQEELDDDVLGLIYFSDLMPWSWDFEEPDYPVLWASWNDRVAPFGETIHIYAER